MSSNQKNFSQANVCSEQEFEKLLSRSEAHFKSKRSSSLKPGAPQSNSLKIVPPIRRRESAA